MKIDLTQRSSLGQVNSLTSMRFLAATFPIIFHCSSTFLTGKIAFLDACSLEQCLSFFFVLSGFILCSSYPQLDSRRDVAQFFMARIGRVWPAHLAAILVFALLNPDWWLPAASKVPYITLANVVLMQSWVPRSTWYFSLNATAWSVSTECFFYLAFPFLIKNWSTTWSKKLLGSAVLIVSLLTLCNFLQAHGTHTPILKIYHALIYINPCSRIFEFVVGMATARLFIELQHKQLSATTASVLEYSIFALVLLNLYFTPLFLGSNHVHSLQAGVHWLNYSSGTPLYAALIAILALQKGSLSRLLSTNWLVFLGETSYSMYIFHWIILQKFFSSPTPEHLLWPKFALYCVVVIVVGIIGYYCVEQPFRKLFKKLAKSIR